MTLDMKSYFTDCEDLAETTPCAWAKGLKGSAILAIAAEVRELKAQGRDVHNFTIGDFDSSVFPIPAALSAGITAALAAGHSNYPPAIGTPELRSGVRKLYRDELGLDYPAGSVMVGSGARPPIYAAFRALVAPGDTVVYPVPSWNVNHYTYMLGGKGVELVTSPETGFMPTVEALLPHLPSARLIVLNNPLNPSGTVASDELLREVCEAIVAENARRREAGERPCILLYDQVYWQLVYGQYRHVTPMELVPEMAAYTVLVDAISKAWAATGLRVGWAVGPPWLIGRMNPVIGHVGAWAARAEQIATAKILENPELLGTFLDDFRGALEERMVTLQKGFQAMKADGLPVDALDAQGAIYLSVRFDFIGKTTASGQVLKTDEDVRSYLLHRAGVAVVPFTAFGYPAGSSWMRLSVGSVTMDAVRQSLVSLRAAISEVS
jgi:aspartate aminotransferase